MHSALAVPEIIRTILDCLLPKPKHYRKTYKEFYLEVMASRSSALNVALTCRSFSEQALDALWWAMHDLIPLFNLLPGFQNEQEIHFPISEHAREVFDRYASRIRFYCVMGTAEDPVNFNSYVQVLQTLGRFNLLPRLQFLYTERNEPQLLFFGSPYLCTFRAKRDLTRNANFDHIQSFLDLLPDTSPKTQALYMRFPLRERSLHAVRRMPELQFLTLDTENASLRVSLGVDFLTNFASRRTLDEWSLRGNIGIAPLPLSGFSILDFDRLTYLSLVSKKKTSIAEYIPLLRAGKFPSLERIEVHLTLGDHTPIKSLSPTKLWHDFFKYLRSATTDSLLAIDVMIKGPMACRVSYNDILDLPSFNLESFETNIFHSLSAVNLFSMLACWPELSVFHISGVDNVTIGFSSLVEIASRFPYLEDLEIQINCSILPTVDHVPVLQHTLETLTLWPLHLEKHITLARWIDKIFPKLAVLNISGSPPSLKSGVGMEIQEIHEGLQSARKDQRTRDQVSTSN